MKFNEILKSRRFCFISNKGKSYLSNLIRFFANDSEIHFSFNQLKLLELKAYNPNIIIIDKYFLSKNHDNLIKSIKLNFKHTSIFVISPEHSNQSNLIQHTNNKKLFSSNLNKDILKHINSFGNKIYKC